jgi:hypothetical protein
MTKIGELVFDTLGNLGVGTIIDRYTSFHDDPAGQEMLVVRWAGEEDSVADRLPEEVRPPTRGEVMMGLAQAAGCLDVLVKGLSFDRLAGRPGANTEIAYTYRDADNHKQHAVIVLRGEIDADGLTAILGKLDDHQGFIPGQVGLDDLQERTSNGWDADSDHPWHELDSIGLTMRAPTELLTAAEIAERFRQVDWDKAHRPECVRDDSPKLW